VTITAGTILSGTTLVLISIKGRSDENGVFSISQTVFPTLTDYQNQIFKMVVDVG
jgi:hypothetical protein